MILKRYFGLNNEAIFFNNCDGVLRIGREEEHIALSVSGTKLLIDYLCDLVFFFDIDEATEVEKLIIRGHDTIFINGNINDDKKTISIVQQKEEECLKILFQNSFEVTEFQDVLCSMSLYCVAPSLFQYLNLVRFFKELLDVEDSLSKFNNWCDSDISNISDWKNKLFKTILPNESLKQEELSLLIIMNLEFLQSYYQMFYAMFIK